MVLWIVLTSPLGSQIPCELRRSDCCAEISESPIEADVMLVGSCWMKPRPGPCRRLRQPGVLQDEATADAQAFWLQQRAHPHPHLWWELPQDRWAWFSLERCKNWVWYRIEQNYTSTPAICTHLGWQEGCLKSPRRPIISSATTWGWPFP